MGACPTPSFGQTPVGSRNGRQTRPIHPSLRRSSQRSDLLTFRAALAFGRGSAPDDHAAPRHRTRRHSLGNALALAICRVLSRCCRESGVNGRGLHSSCGTSVARRPGAFQARMVRADRQLQGSRRVCHDLGASPARDHPAARRQFRKRDAAIAAYAAAGEINAKILVPAATQPGKIVQMRAYGAEVELIPGTRQDTSDEAERQAERIFYASHNWRPSSFGGRSRWLMSFGKTSGSGRPTTSSYPPAPAATSSDTTSASANSCYAGRSSGFLGFSPSSPRTAPPLHELRLGR